MKPWFEANRNRYEQHLNQPCKALADLVAAEFARLDFPLTGDGKRSTFRIHRDMRFSKDKTPYKTNGSVVWMRPGFKKESGGVVYLHIADTGCFLAAGFYEVERGAVDAIRSAVRDDKPGFTAAMDSAAQAGLALDTSDSMVRMPRGFEDVSDPALVPVIKSRHLVATRPLSKRAVGSSALVGTIVATAQAALPLLEFGWRAVDEYGPPPEWSRLH